MGSRGSVTGRSDAERLARRSARRTNAMLHEPDGSAP